MAVAYALLARRRARAGVLDTAGREALLAELVEGHRLRVCYRRRLGRRLEALRRGRERVGAMRHPDEVRALDALYAEEKRRRNLVDFDDLIEQATALCEREPAPPRHLLIDELQDCAPRELALVRALRGPDTALFAVGDPQQAIYGWRGAAASAFAQLAAEPGARVLPLARSYRSTATILDAARALLAVSGPRAAPLEAVRGAGARVVVRRHHTPLCEALYLADRIAALRAAGVAPGDVAILHRVQRQGETLRAVLAARGVPLAPRDEDPVGAPPVRREGGVHTLTIHAAKGLEFRHVFVIGCNDGLVPLIGGAGAAETEAEAEERRLFYVAITRAIDTLEVSFCTEPEHPGARGGPSRFLALFPAAVVAREPRPEPVASAAAWRAGQAVRHGRYGAGTVIEVAGGKVRCAFGRLGERSFDERLCPLTAA
jgi:superfamily I DNA/RNA helicase